jgi:hypothetical protein
MAASFKKAIIWIAANDETAEMDPTVIAEFISVALVADLFGRTAEDVADLVARKRKEWDR